MARYEHKYKHLPESAFPQIMDMTTATVYLFRDEQSTDKLHTLIEVGAVHTTRMPYSKKVFITKKELDAFLKEHSPSNYKYKREVANV